jgi:DNA-binding XRE family transcriptional regulator
MLKYSILHDSSGGMLLVPNRLKEVRENLLVCKSELARKAGISTLTISRIERGTPCRQETKRKILAALGFTPLDKDKVFPEN